MDDKKDTKPDGAPAHDGFIDGFMSKILGRSWKTSIAGWVAIACGIVQVIPGVPQVVRDVCLVVGPVAGGTGLVQAKDKNVHGSNR